MTSAAAAIFSYVLFVMSDMLNLKLKGRGLLSPALFISGSAVLIISFFRIIFSSLYSDILRISVLPAVLFIVFLILLLYSVFPGLMHEAAAAEKPLDGKQPLVSHGIYALCRHPGVLWMAGCCICLYYICPVGDMAVMGILSTALDVIYVFWQDHFLFPKIISGYEKYKRETPFLIPTPSSVSLCLNYLLKR